MTPGADADSTALMIAGPAVGGPAASGPAVSARGVVGEPAAVPSVVVPGVTVAGVGVPVTVLACAVALYALARRRTAGASAPAVIAVAAATAGVVAGVGASPRIVAACAALAFGMGAALWALGRSRRRRAAVREGSAHYFLQAPAVSRHAAREERTRFAAELHDVVAHRLTGVVVSAGAACRLDDPELRAEALRHAGEAGRAALAELDALADALDPPRSLRDLDVLVADRPSVRYTRSVAAATETSSALAFRVLREALTNAGRYAAGAPVRVTVDADGRDLVVDVQDGGGAPTGKGLGSGSGLDALRRAVAAAGGRLDAGPDGAGWRVLARLPDAAPAPTSVGEPPIGDGPARPALGPRGTLALGAALALLAFALPLGAGLIPAGGPDVFAASGAARGLLAVLLAAHAAPLAFRRAMPLAAPLTASAALLAWLACERLGWTAPHSTDVLLWCWWGDLVLVGSAASNAPSGLRARRTWPVPVVVAAVAGLALAGDGVTEPLLAWAVFTAGCAVPALAMWALGLRAGSRRRAVVAAEESRRDSVERHAADAARAERLRLIRGLRDTARARVAAVVAAADRGELPAVLAEGRAAMAVLRELLAELRADPGSDDDPPPTLAGVAGLAARHRAATRLTGEVRPFPPAVEVAAYRAVEALITDEARIGIHFASDALEITVTGAHEVAPPRGLRAMVDAADGTVTVADGGTVRVWLPGTVRT
ncbi:sensor histidine kinase [Microtetraspora fusca]|uniref:sensor histidine kinase n=1 Tax=Microtetraspora fusca TaxID=1997 RepID=UPI000835AD34|nr:histidine kinase [Microtetraspora fusca]